MSVTPQRNPLIHAITLALSLLILSLIAYPAPARDWNVIDAGATPDGRADCTAAFQRALDEAGAAGGGVVQVPAGVFAIKGVLSIPAGVTLQGTFRVPPNTPRRHAPQSTGSRLLAFAGRGKPDAPPFIRLAGDAAVLAGLIIEYPEWKQADVPPVPYPPCVLAQGVENTGIQDCLLLNPYEGIRLVRAARHYVSRVYGYPISRGLYVDECYDIGRVENCHFWPFGLAYKADDPYCLWINTNGVSFEFARTDWEYVSNTFSFGYGVGYKFSATKAGAANGNFLGIGADSARRPVLVEQAQPWGILITNGEFVGRWGSGDSVGLEIAPGAQGKVSLNNCSFWGPLDRCVWAHGAPESQFTASACNFAEWDHGGSGSPAIQVDSGAAIVQGNTFGSRASQHVRVGSAVRSTILTANQAAGGFLVRNEAGKRCQALANEECPVELTSEALDHYFIQVGRDGDARFLDGFHGCEKNADANTSLTTFRWSSPRSRLQLPLNPGKPYRVRLTLTVPPQSLSPDSGLYLGDQKLVALDRSGPLALECRITAPPSGHAELALRCKTWSPKATQPGNNDARELGVMLRAIEVQAEGAPPKAIHANTGEWIN